MKKEVLKDTVEKTRALIDAPTCSAETKAAAQRWLAAVGTEAEQAETKAYIAELEEDIMPIDSLIGFARSANRNITMCRIILSSPSSWFMRAIRPFSPESPLQSHRRGSRSTSRPPP